MLFEALIASSQDATPAAAPAEQPPTSFPFPDRSGPGSPKATIVRRVRVAALAELVQTAAKELADVASLTFEVIAGLDEESVGSVPRCVNHHWLLCYLPATLLTAFDLALDGCG